MILLAADVNRPNMAASEEARKEPLGTSDYERIHGPVS